MFFSLCIKVDLIIDLCKLDAEYSWHELFTTKNRLGNKWWTESILRYNLGIKCQFLYIFYPCASRLTWINGLCKLNVEYSWHELLATKIRLGNSWEIEYILRYNSGTKYVILPFLFFAHQGWLESLINVSLMSSIIDMNFCCRFCRKLNVRCHLTLGDCKTKRCQTRVGRPWKDQLWTTRNQQNQITGRIQQIHLKCNPLLLTILVFTAGATSVGLYNYPIIFPLNDNTKHLRRINAKDVLFSPRLLPDGFWFLTTTNFTFVSSMILISVAICLDGGKFGQHHQLSWLPWLLVMWDGRAAGSTLCGHHRECPHPYWVCRVVFVPLVIS